MPHGLEIDVNSSVWITDVALHQVLLIFFCTTYIILLSHHGCVY